MDFNGNFSLSYNTTTTANQSSTGLISGGVLSLVGAADASPLFDISDGQGVINNNDGSVSTIDWTGLINQTATYTGTLTYVSINSNRVVVYRSSEPTFDVQRSEIFIGVLVHITSPTNPTGLNLTTVNQESSIATFPTNQIHDLMHSIGFLNTGGNLLSGSLLKIAKSSGKMFGEGINYQNDVLNPHELTLSAIDTSASGTFQYADQFNNRSALTLTDITPGVYDNGVDPSSYPPSGVVATNKWVAHRVFSFVSNSLKIQFGQFLYNSSSEARGGIMTEDFITEPSFEANGMLIGYIICRGGALNLALTADCEFVSSGKFGNASSTVSGSVSTLQNTYDNSGVEPEILTDGTNGALTIQEGVSDSNDTLVVNNMAGTSTWHVQGGGEMRLIHTAVEDSDHSFEIDHFADGMADSKAIDIVYETGDISALAEESAILINVDKTASDGGNVNGIVSLATEGSANCTALEAGAQVDVLKQLSGSFSDPSTGNVDNNGSTVSVGSLSGVNLFASDNDYLIVANILSFEEIEFLMSQFASGSGIAPEFEYQTVGPVWTQFFPTDGTNGLRNNGVIAWTISDIPGQVLDGGVYKIRITRTRNSLATVPQAINNGIKVVVAEEFGWDKNADLSVNDISMKGGIYSTAVPNNWLDFDSTGDVKM
jgi:hypothetical protein